LYRAGSFYTSKNDFFGGGSRKLLATGRKYEAQPKLTGARRYTFKRKEIGYLVKVVAVDTAKKIAPFLNYR
jgi:hypothetical protein